MQKNKSILKNTQQLSTSTKTNSQTMKSSGLSKKKNKRDSNLLGSNFITGLLKEKAMAEELINADNQTTMKIQKLKYDGGVIREDETKKQRK